METIGGINELFAKIAPVARRPNVEWMTKSDDRILETLESSGLALSPKVLAHNTGYEGNTISKRLKPLRSHGLVKRVDRGLYEITDDGRSYLAGELDAGDLEK